jgi:hypothetical protein
LRTVAAGWEFPALVLSDKGAIQVESAQQIEQFFGDARKNASKQEVVTATPDVQKTEWLTEAMVQVRVKWQNLTAKREPRGDELAVYVLRRDADRRLRIRVAIMLGG